MKLPHRRWIEISAVAFVVVTLATLLVPAIQQAREAARRSHSKNNLKQLGLALHNYHEVHACFPPGAVVEEHGRGHSGWSTSLLPFLDASPHFSMLWMDYPWDDPVNCQIYMQRYRSFEAPDAEKVFTADGYGISSYTANPSVFFQNSSTSLGDVTDHSSAWMMAEVNSGLVPWGYPWNWRQFPKTLSGNSNGFLHESGTAQVLLVDGSTRTFSADTDWRILAALTVGGPTPDPNLTRVPARVFDLVGDSPGQMRYLMFPQEASTSDFVEQELKLWINRSNGSVFVRTAPVAKLTRQVTRQDLEFLIENVPDTTHFRMDDDAGDEELKILTQLKKLESLAVNQLVLSDAGVQILNSMLALRLITVETLKVPGNKRLRPEIRLRAKWRGAMGHEENSTTPE